TEASPTYLSIETTETGAAGAFISNGGRIESKGLLVIETGEDISLRNGAVVQNNGSRPATTVLNAGHNLVIESKTNVNNAKGPATLSAGGRTTINDATIQAGSSVYSSTKGDTELGENTRIIAENVTVLSNGSISSAAVIEAQDTAHIESGKPLSLETSTVASNIRLNNGNIKGGKQVVLMADGDIQAKASNLNASGNLYIHAGKDLDLNADKDLSTQSISLRADNTALISSNGNTLTAEKNLDIQAGSLSVRQSNLQSSGGNVQMSATKGNISLNQSWINASQNIDTAALQGNIISDGLTAVAEVGRVSLLANGNVDFNGLNTLIAEGDINAGSVGKGRLKMDNTDIYASAGDVKLVAGGQLDLGNGTVNGGHISLDSNKGSMVVQNVHLNARASLKVDADQTLTINNSKLNSGHNTQINTNHGHMTLNQLDAHSHRHMSISAQGKGKGKDSGQILQNDQQNSKSTLAADGVLSLNSSALQVLDNTTLRGGAINIKAGGGIIKRGHIDWETQDTATMRSAERKPLSGMMSIESGGNNPLTVEPGNRIVSAGDLAVKHNGTFQISARAGNNGNPSAQTASVSAKGNIGIVAGEVDIDAANIAAGKDLALVATKGNISLNSIRNTFSNYQLKTDKHNITQQLTDVEQELSKLTSDPKYRKAQDLPQMLRRKYKRRDKVFGDSEARLRGLRAEINAADEAWAELQSPVKALLERKQLLQQALLTVSQPGSGHENQGSTLSGQNIKLLAAGGIRIQGSKVAATQQANIQAAGFLPAPAAEELQEGRLQSAIDISGVFDTFEYGQQGSDKYGYAIFSRPSEISGKTGVTLSAPNANENSRISLSAANIEAENGKIKIQSYGDQYYYARQSELYTFERRSYKTGKWYNRKHITEVKEHKNAKPDAVNLSASQGIDIKSGGSIDAYATAFDAPKGSINIEAGRKLTLYAVEELNYDKLDSQKRRRFLGISYSKAHDTTTQVMKTALPSRVVAESANLQSGWDTKLQGTQFETTLGGATIRAGVGEQARADAKIILEGIKTTIHNETVSSSKSALWQKQAGRGSNIETLQLPSFTGPVAPVLSAPGGYIVDIPKGNLKTQIETLTKQPEYAYLKQLQVAKNINWNQVQLAYDKWDYKQEGLTEAGAAIIALAVTVVTSGAGTGAVLGLNGAAAAATDAAFASLASQASVSFINNKGDVGKTLKELGRSSTVKNLVVA
ncbi:TPA: hemagglutinin, partial [Neisseria meningitidis]